MDKHKRRAFLASLPYIRLLRQSTSCDGLRWSEMPLKAIYSMHGKPPTGTGKYQCKNPALWQFAALKRSYQPAKSGTYCMAHLISLGLHYNQEEIDRVNRYWEKWQAKE